MFHFLLDHAASFSRQSLNEIVHLNIDIPLIRPGQSRLARHSDRGKKTRQTEEEVGRQHQGMDRPGVRQVPRGSEEQGRMEETGCEIINSTPMTLAVKG